MTDVIYLAPLCQEHERMWCEHDAPIDCECIDGPHPWIKYIAALRQPTQSEITQADIDAAESIFWVETIIDDHEAVAKAFARHHQHGYDQGYYDGITHPIVLSDALRKALRTARDYVEAVVEAATDSRSAHIKAMAAADLITIDAALQEQSK